VIGLVLLALALIVAGFILLRSVMVRRG